MMEGTLSRLYHTAINFGYSFSEMLDYMEFRAPLNVEYSDIVDFLVSVEK